MAENEFSVIDVETTGFSPKNYDRVVEVGITRVTQDGSVVDSLETLVNPRRDVGATSVHGINASMVADAPAFEEVAPAVVDFMNDSVVVSHNAPFDRSFLLHELSSAGYRVPDLPAICTLSLARDLVRDAPSKKLPCLCEYFGIDPGRQHSALSDAMATAQLLFILQQEYDALNAVGPIDPFTAPALGTSSSHQPPLRPRDEVLSDQQSRESPLAKMLQRLPTVEQGSEDTLAYADLLDQVLLDRIVTSEESHALLDLADELGMSQEQVRDIHLEYLKNIVRVALIDGKISESEKADIENVRQLLSLEQTDLEDIHEELRNDPSATEMSDIAKGYQGKSVCFTGELCAKVNGEKITRSHAQKIAMERGLTVRKSVTNNLDYLVVADPATESLKARKARENGIPIVSESAFWRMIGLQVD